MKYLVFILLVSAFVSCNNDIVYQETLKISDAKWNRNELAKFSFNIEDSLSSYDLYLMIRHAGNFPYKNLYLFSKTYGPRDVFAKDTAQMIFADDKGNWLGKGIGDIYDYEFKFKEQIVFPYKGEYQIHLEQAMRDIEVEGVTDIGIKLKKSIPNNE